jgi:hypothetical protein
MSRLFTILVAVLALAQFAPRAAAHVWFCPDGFCLDRGSLPGWPRARAHNFHPRLRDGVPLVNDFPNDPEGYYGVGCIWAWRALATPVGPAWRWVRDCVTY